LHASGQSGPDPQISLELTGVSESLAEAISDLREHERLVVPLYYYEELTLREFGEVRRVTESRVSQLHTKGDPAPQGAPLGRPREPAET
jgi:RNA polymerase sigma factor for flagellar operon FliA